MMNISSSHPPTLQYLFLLYVVIYSNLNPLWNFIRKFIWGKTLPSRHAERPAVASPCSKCNFNSTSQFLYKLKKVAKVKERNLTAQLFGLKIVRKCVKHLLHEVPSEGLLEDVNAAL